MKKMLLAALILIALTECKQKVLSGEELKKKLVSTMQNFLDTSARNGITFTVKDVAYYPEVKTTSYDCQFHVTMHTGSKDSTGMMAAFITNDFLHVDRTR